MTVTFESSTLATPPAGVNVASDTISGIDFQRIKVAWGTTGTANDVSTDNAFPVNLTNASNLTIGVSSSTNNVGSVTVSALSISSSTATIGAVLQGTSPWVTSPSSRVPVDVNSLPSVTLTSGTQVIGSVAPSSQWTVTTTPSSIATVNQGTSPWVTSVSGQMGWLSSSTSSAAIPVIGQVAQATTPWNIANISNPIGWLSSSTSTSITSPPLIGSVAASTIWTVNQGSPPWSVSLTSGSLALGTVTLSSGTQVIGSVAPSSTWTVNLSSGTQVIGAVNQGTSPWVSALTSGTVTLTSGTLALGTVTLSSGTQVIGAVNQGTSPWVVSGSVNLTSGTVTLTSGALALGTVTLSSGALALGTVTLSSGIQVIGSVRASTVWTVASADDVSVLLSSGTALTPSYANVTTSSTLVTLVSTTSAKITTVLSAAFSVNSTSTAAAFSAQFTSSLGSTDKTYSSKFFFPTNGVSQYILPYNPIGWAQTTSSGNLSLQVSAGVAGPGLGCLLTYVSL